MPGFGERFDGPSCRCAIIVVPAQIGATTFLMSDIRQRSDCGRCCGSALGTTIFSPGLWRDRRPAGRLSTAPAWTLVGWILDFSGGDSGRPWDPRAYPLDFSGTYYLRSNRSLIVCPAKVQLYHRHDLVEHELAAVMAGSSMGVIHNLIQQRGRDGALQAGGDRRAVEAATQYMAEEETGIGFVFSGWAQAALPHRRIDDDAVWRVDTERVTLLVEPGRRPRPGAGVEWVGVPYGSRARLIMLYLQSEALRTNSRQIELGRSLNAWLIRLGIPIGGKSFKDVRAQAERISRCRLTFHISRSDRSGLVNQNILDTAMFVDDDPMQSSLFLETARLSETFFEQLKRHPVPLEEAAIKAINNNSMALDLYCWLAYRLHVLQRPTPVTWKALHQQFGAGFRRLDHFRQKFLENLNLATAVYPDARLQIGPPGLTLLPSRPPVPARTAIFR